MLLQSEHALPLGEATCGGGVGWGRVGGEEGMKRGVRRGCTHCKHSTQWEYHIQCKQGGEVSVNCL